MKTLQMFLLGIGFFCFVGYLIKRASIGNRNLLLTGKFSFKNELRGAGKVLLAFLLFLIYTAIIFIIFNNVV